MNKQKLELFKAYFPYIIIIALIVALKTKDKDVKQANQVYNEERREMLQLILNLQKEQYLQYEKLLSVTNAYLKLIENEKNFSNSTRPTHSDSIRGR